MGTPGENLGALIFLLMAVAVAAALLVLARLIGPRKRKRGKTDPYECGIPHTGGARGRFSIKFYLIALLFSLFDIEAVFLIPWAVAFKQMSTAALIEAGVFVGVLLLGLIYIIRRGVLKWDT